MYIGDDINYLDVINRVEFSECPLDVTEEVKERVTFISKYNVGEGSREVIEQVLKRQEKID